MNYNKILMEKGDRMTQLSWKKLLSSETLVQRTTAEGQKGRDDYDGRTAFDSDYDRIIFSYPFRRLQDKAQLFPLESNDFVRTRLTHSLEVSALAKSLGISIVERISADKKDKYEWDDKYKHDFPKILECAGLVHDLGNPPFGHFGEKTIGDTLIKILNKYKEDNLNFKEISLTEQQEADIKNFEGNSQSFRILTHLQCIKDKYGYHLTSALLASIVKYPVDSTKGNKEKDEDIRLHKFGYFFSENEIIKEVFSKTGLVAADGSYIRHPLAFLMEAADDMAYCAGDIEDGFKKHLFTIAELLTFIKEFNADKNDAKIQELIDYMENISTKAEYYSDEKKIQDIRIKLQQIMFRSIIDTFMKNYDEIMNGKFKKELIKESDVCILRECLKQITKMYLFSNKEVILKEIMGKKIISELVTLYADSLFNIDKDNPKVISFDKRIMELISTDYLVVFRKNTGCNEDYNNIQISQNTVYYILLLIADQISGMTDTYCLSLYRKLHAIKV